MFLTSSSIKDSPTLYLSHQLIRYSTVKVMTTTRPEVMTNYGCQHTGRGGHSYDLSCCRSCEQRDECPHLFTRHRCVAFGSTKNTTTWEQTKDDAVFLQPIYDKLCNFAGLGEGDEPSEEVLRGCEEFLCSLLCPHWASKDAQVGFV